MKLLQQSLGFTVFLLMFLAGGSASGQRVKGDISESEYDKKLRSEQESTFSPWMPAKEAFEVARRAKLDGRLLLAAENNSNAQIRLLLFFPPDGKGGDVIWETDVPEATLLERHAIWQKQDYNILFARKNPTGNYAAIWINSARLGVAVKRLNEVGISAAAIRIKSGETANAPAAVAKAAVTTPLRQWRDKSGRLLQASVAGIDAGTVSFVRADGKKFPFPLADLSDQDQKYLTDLQSKSAQDSGAVPSAATPGGFTDWMSRSDFDTKLAEERGKGNFPIYVESNTRNEFRGIHDKRPGTVRFFQAWAEPEQSLREKHASYIAQGFSLLTLSFERRTDKYCGVWVSGIAPGDAKAMLGKFGMTQASIDEKITTTTVPKR
jgi:hypothetical protein